MGKIIENKDKWISVLHQPNVISSMKFWVIQLSIIYCTKSSVTDTWEEMGWSATIKSCCGSNWCQIITHRALNHILYSLFNWKETIFKSDGLSHVEMLLLTLCSKFWMTLQIPGDMGCVMEAGSSSAPPQSLAAEAFTYQIGKHLSGEEIVHADFRNTRVNFTKLCYETKDLIVLYQNGTINTVNIFLVVVLLQRCTKIRIGPFPTNVWFD